jgi:MFS family permease
MPGWVAHWRDYLAVTALTAAEGTTAMLVPLLLADNGYSTAEIGPLVALFGLAALVSRFPIGAAYRPARARWLLGISLVVAALSSLLYPYAAASGSLFVVVRVVNGLASGTATTVNLAFFMDSLPAGTARARGMGLYGGGMAAGFTLGNLTGGFMGEMFGYGGAFGIGAVFWMIGLCQALVTAVPIAGNRDISETRSSRGPAHSSRSKAVTATLRALGDPGVASVTTMAFGLNALHQVGMTFFPLLARNLGLGLAEIGLIRSAYSLINAIARPLSSPAIDRLGARRVSFSSYVAQAVVIACIPLLALGGLPAFMLLFALSGSMRAVGFTANATALAEDIPESRLSRGLASSLFSASRDLGNLSGPLIGSALASIIGLEAMFVAAPVLLVLLCTGVTSGVRRKTERA